MGPLRGRSIRRLLLLLLLPGGLIAGAKCTNPAQAAGIPLLDQASFAVRTMYTKTTADCAGEKVQTGPIAQPIVVAGIRVPNLVTVPVLVDVDGNHTDDLSVSLVVIPGSAVGAQDVVRLTIAKLPGAPSKMLAEVIMAPGGAGKPRVRFGYNGCEDGAPGTFVANITRTVNGNTTKLDLNAPTIQSSPSSLKLIGGAFDDPGANSSNRPNPVDISVRMQPVPSSMHAVVTMVGSDDYTAVLTPNAATKLGVDLFRKQGAQTMSLTGTLDKATPGDLTVKYNPSKIFYSAPSAFTAIDLNLESFTPATGVTDTYKVNLTGVPKTATINRNGSAMSLVLPSGTSIATTKVRYSSWAGDGAPGALTVPVIDRAGHLAQQYLAANVDLGGFIAETKVLGLSGANIDTGDPVKVGLDHPAAPFYIDAQQRSLEATDGCATCPLRFVNRHLQTSILNMPDGTNVSYSPKTGIFSYSGKGVIGTLHTRLESSRALVDDANIARLTLTNVPSGLTGRIDSKAKTFTAAVTTGAIGAVEAQVTSGPDERLPSGQDGILLNDHADHYVAFVRVQNLTSTTVGWGDTQSATVSHTAAPFVMRVNADDPDLGAGKAFTVDGTITKLPSTAHVEYTPTATKSTFRYNGSGLIDEVRFVLRTATPFDPDKGTDTAKILARQVPSVTIETDEVAHTINAFVPPGIILDPGDIGGEIGGITAPATATPTSASPLSSAKLIIDNTPKKVGLIFIEVCKADSCALSEPVFNPTSTTSQPDRVWVIDRTGQYDVQALVRGLSSFTATIVKDADEGLQSAAVKLDHDAGPFDVLTLADKSKTITVQGPKNDFGQGTVFSHTYNWLEVVDVKARDLPQTVELAYDPILGKVDYTGSAKVTDLDVQYSKSGDGQMVVGRAPKLHVHIHDLAPGAHVTYATDGSLDFSLDTGGVPIGHIDLELLSDPGILTREAIATNEITRGIRDGLIMWDLHRTEYTGGLNQQGQQVRRIHGGSTDPLEDPYAIIVRVTNLTHFDLAKATDEYTTAPDMRDILQATLSRFNQRKNIAVEVRRDNVDKRWPQISNGELAILRDAEPIAGWTDPQNEKTYFNDEYLKIFYNSPPTSLGFRFANRYGTNKKQAWVDVWGNQDGGAVNVDTNFASITWLGSDVFPIPAGPETDPGVAMCISVDVFSCAPSQYDAESWKDSQTAVSLEVNSPVYLHVDVFQGNTETDFAGHIERVLRGGTEGKDTGITDVASTHVYLDTDNYAIDGMLQVLEDGDLHTYINAPKNTRADGRSVDVEDIGVNDGFNFGQLMCPAGFTAEVWVWPQYLSVSDDLCTRSVLTNKTQDVIHRGDTGKTVDLYGWSFVDETVDGANNRIIGTSVTFSDPRIVVTSWAWVGPGHIRVTVDVPSAVPTGGYAITVGNPNTGDDTQVTNDAPSACACKLNVT